MLEEMPKDIITMIIDNMNDATSLVCTCRRFYSIGQEYGYIKHLYYRNGDDLDEFKRKYILHRRHIKSVVIDGLNDPQQWLIFYPKCILMNIISTPIDRSIIQEYNFDPPFYTETEELYIIAARFSPCLLKINCKKFLKLRILYLSAHTIVMDNISTLQNVTEISMDIGNNQSINSKMFEDFKRLPKLRSININMIMTKPEQIMTFHDLRQKGVRVNHEFDCNPNYQKMYMYLITGKSKP